MRLATLHLDGREVAVVADGDRYVPLEQLGLDLPGDLLALLREGLSEARRSPIAARVRKTDAGVPRADAVLAPPYRAPAKLWGIGLNYRGHADDLGANHPTEPASFLKGAHTIVGPGDAIHLPPQSERVTAEGELGLVIGRTCWQVDVEDALDHVAAVVPILDQTAEDILQRDPRFLTRSKNFPTFLAFGPELVTLDEVLVHGRLDHLEVATWHNGTVHRRAPVADMTFDPAHLVAFHSQVMPLYPGDIISTGTPGAIPLADGDVVEAHVEGLTPLRCPVVAGHVPSPPPVPGGPR
jgi:2-keto-4-pentenoate hydratase/2-oxohepta-3-ene-1,7-dioic acid hydratase in catechol pathway